MEACRTVLLLEAKESPGGSRAFIVHIRHASHAPLMSNKADETKAQQ